MVWIGFTGDLMSQIQQNEACRTADGYDFGRVLAPVAAVLSGHDFLVGNLETPLAGEDLRYSFERYSFNTPLAFAKAVQAAGFSLVSTANNHCLDRGTQGLCRTLDALDAIGLPHIGTYRTQAERDAPFLLSLGGILFGFVASTYGTNAMANHLYLGEEERHMVALSQPQEELPGAVNLLDRANVASRVQAVYGDPDAPEAALVRPYLARLQADIAALRAAGAEIVIALPHTGGQYNAQPDAYTRMLCGVVRAAGADVLVCNHEHTLHPVEADGAQLTAYCLGNFIDRPDLMPQGLPASGEYAAVLSLAFDRGPDGRARLTEARVTPTKSVLLPDGAAAVFPVHTLLRQASGEEKTALLQDNARIVRLLRGAPPRADEAPGQYRVFP